MPFDLNITFAGMCLLVRDTTGGRLQVLMPPTGEHAAGDRERHGHATPVPKHVPRLAYYRDRLSENGKDGGSVELIPLEDAVIDLSELEADPKFDLTTPADVQDLGEITDTKVPRELFDEDTGGRVLSRVTLAKGEVSWHHPGGRSTLGKAGTRRRAIATTWTVKDVEGDRLELEITGLNKAVRSQRLTLYPDTDGVLHLYVFHSPPNEIRTDWLPRARRGDKPWEDTSPPVKGDRAEHFAAFYTLYDFPHVPVFEDDPAPPAEAAVEKEGILGMKFTCITASGTA